RRKSLFGCRRLCGQQFAMGQKIFDFEAESVIELPALLGQQCPAGFQIRKGRDVRGRHLCASARNKIQFCDAKTLLRRRYETSAPVELIHDLEDFLFDLRWCSPRRENSADLKVNGTASIFSDQ